MKIIQKFELSWGAKEDGINLEMHGGMTILGVSTEPSDSAPGGFIPVMHAIIETEAPCFKRKIYVYETGDVFKDNNVTHLGTVALNGREYHFFMESHHL